MSTLNSARNYIVRINPITGEELHYYKAPAQVSNNSNIDYRKEHGQRVSELLKVNDSINMSSSILPVKEKKTIVEQASSTKANASSIPMLNFADLLLNSDSNRLNETNKNENNKNDDVIVVSKLNDFKNQNPIVAPELLDRSQSHRPLSSYRHGYKYLDNFKSPLLNYESQLKQDTEQIPSKLEAPRDSKDMMRLDLESLNKPAEEKKNSIYKIERVADLEKLWLTNTPGLNLNNMNSNATEKDLKEKIVIDTVLTDQLSRFSLSDPNQTESLTNRLSQTPLRTIYTNQGNKFTLLDRQKMSSSDLSKRIKFNCRIKSPNGKLALRELFGLFFLQDGSLTIYEFKLLCGASLTGLGSGNVSKKANALPFLNRKIYKHSYGRRKNLQINIYDIFKGSVLYLESANQIHELEITDVDELEKENMLVSYEINNRKEDINRNVNEIKQKLKMTWTNDEINDAKIINSMRMFIRGQIESRSVEVYMGMAQKLKSFNRLINKQEFCDCLCEFNILVHSEDVNIVWQVLDLNMDDCLSYYKLMRSYFGQMSSHRHSFFRQLILKLDTQKIGFVQVNDIYKYYKAGKHPKVKQGQMTETDMFKKFLSPFQLLDPKKINELNELSTTTSMDNTKSMLISYEQLEDYYNGLSICVDSDQDFMQILQNSWSV